MIETNKIYCMDCLEGLKLLDEESVDCCVTSPPYWSLRDYGHPCQIGQEDTPEEYVDRLLAVFSEVRRVLKKEGTVWLNIADTYFGSSGNAAHSDPKYPAGRTGQKKAGSRKAVGIKAKDLVGIPWAMAFALRDLGFYLRNDIIWAKTNVMPESVRDRCTKSHEHIFLLAKSRQYYFDRKGIREEASYDGRKDEIHKGSLKYSADKEASLQQYNRKGGSRWPDSEDGIRYRNKRDVWHQPSGQLKESHYAAFPVKLIEPCILAGCPPGGIVLDPFMGSGTTALAALTHGRRYLGFELNQEYVLLAEKRIASANISIMEYLYTIKGETES